MGDDIDRVKGDGPGGSSSVMLLNPASADAGRARAVVAVRGEQDLATAEALSALLLWAAMLTDDDLVVDLSEVQFMDASTVTVIVATRAALAERSRSLTLQAPSTCARHVIELCGLADLIEPRVSAVAAAPHVGAGPAMPTATSSGGYWGASA